MGFRVEESDDAALLPGRDDAQAMPVPRIEAERGVEMAAEHILGPLREAPAGERLQFRFREDLGAVGGAPVDQGFADEVGAAQTLVPPAGKQACGVSPHQLVQPKPWAG